MEHAEGYEKRWWILGVLCLSLLIIVMDNTILNVALPTLVRKLSASESQLQWMVDAYTLLFAGLLLTMGNLGDKFGKRPHIGFEAERGGVKLGGENVVDEDRGRLGAFAHEGRVRNYSRNYLRNYLLYQRREARSGGIWLVDSAAEFTVGG